MQNNIAVSYGGSVTINAFLLPNLDNLSQNGNGTLRYRITFPAGAAGVLKLSSYPDNTQIGSAIILTETVNNGEVELASGYYYINVSIEHGGRVRIWDELFHISDNAITEAVVGPDDFTDPLPPPGTVDIYLSMDKFTLADEAAGVFDGVPPVVLRKGTDTSETIAAAGLVVVAWRVGDTVMGTGNSITLHPSLFPMGVYTLNLVFIKDGKPWLGSLTFEVIGNLPDDYYELITEDNKYQIGNSFQSFYDANVGTYRVVRGSETPPDVVYINTYYNGLLVTEIGYMSFSGRTNITAVHAPNTITLVHHNAFDAVLA